MKQPTTKNQRKTTEQPPEKKRRFRLRSPRWLGLVIVLVFLCALMGFTGAFTGAALVLPEPAAYVEVIDTNRPFYANAAMGPEAARSSLSPVFTDTVQYWAPMIQAWALMYEVDPNVIATVIQIESCGDPTVSFRLDSGDVVELVDSTGFVIARGVSTYSSQELPQLLGHSTVELRETKGRGWDRVAVHRDDMAVRPSLLSSSED